VVSGMVSTVQSGAEGSTVVIIVVSTVVITSGEW
jgi:hypothetical protein